MSIPKTIHYCWFGGNPIPDKVQKCIESWREKCPDFKIVCWNESNYDISKNEYIKGAYNEKKWAFVTDFARLDIIYEHGGVYLDTDVELIKPLDPLMENEAFFAIDKEGLYVNTGLGFGAIQGNELIGELRSVYEKLSFYREDGTLNTKACTHYVTDILQSYGYEKCDINQNIRNALVLSTDVFCPMNYIDGSINITGNTIGIHWYESSWFSKEDKHLHNVDMKLNSILPRKIAGYASRIYRTIFRFVEYSRKGIIIEEIRKKLRK